MLAAAPGWPIPWRSRPAAWRSIPAQPPPASRRPRATDGGDGELHPAQLTARLVRCDSLQLLQQLLRQHAGDMNAIHVSAAATRCAHLCAPARPPAAAAPGAGAPTAAPPTPQEMPQELLQHLAQLAAQRAPQFQPRQVANTLWALARLQQQPAPGTSDADGGGAAAAAAAAALSTCRLLQQRAAQQWSGFTAGELAMLLQAASCLPEGHRTHPPGWLDACLRQVGRACCCGCAAASLPPGRPPASSRGPCISAAAAAHPA
jgi:hypothetical protein